MDWKCLKMMPGSVKKNELVPDGGVGSPKGCPVGLAQRRSDWDRMGPLLHPRGSGAVLQLRPPARPLSCAQRDPRGSPGLCQGATGM